MQRVKHASTSVKGLMDTDYLTNLAGVKKEQIAFHGFGLINSS